MSDVLIDCDEPIEIADGVHWVGFADERAGFHCNPYLIVDNDEAVLIDSGSRNDFSTVMLKIMRTGVNPKCIQRLVYQHYDPDLCGNIPHMEAMIENDDLKIISHVENNIFIKYYSPKSQRLCIEDIGLHYEFSSGRRLEFIRTPYCHSAGSFITYDTKTKTLFSSDIFGAFDSGWTFFSQVGTDCFECEAKAICHKTNSGCQMLGLVEFAKRIMPTTKSLRYALNLIEDLEISLIAPQHGSIFISRDSKDAALKLLKSLSDVGIDSFLEGCIV